MTKFVLDTWAWVEYFEGSNKGMIVKEIIENPKNNIITHWINISELTSLSERKSLNTKQIMDSLLSISDIFFGDEEFGVYAGKRHAEIRKKIKDFGLVDSIVLATGERLSAKVVTGDPHFKDMKNVVIL